MEEMLLRVCIVVVSLLYIKDHTIFQEQEENIIMDMRKREYLLQKEAAMLEQEVHQVTTWLPYSNQEVLQSHRRSKIANGKDSDVQQVLPSGKVGNPHERRMAPREDQDDLHQNLLKKYIQDEVAPLNHDNGPLTLQHGIPVDEKLSSDKQGQPEIKRTSQNKIKIDDMAGHKNEVPYNDQKMKTLIEDQIKQAHIKTNLEDITEEQQSTENSYNWYLWKCLSLISLIRLLRKFFSKSSQSSGSILSIKDKSTPRSASILSKIFITNHHLLSCFYDQCVRIPPSTRGRVCEFAEGFVDELLEAARGVSNKETDFQIGDFIGVGSLYELWATGKTMVCDLYVPIRAPRSHGFDVELWKDKDASLLGFGRIKMLKAENALNGCPCMDGNPDDEDMLCLIHPHNETSKVMITAVGGPLCQENTAYLSKKQVVRWFRTIIQKAWREISHNYEFELGFRSQIAPGALRVRFRSGQIVLFNITPVVQVNSSKVYLVSYLCTNQNVSDIHWPMSFASYENALLQYFTKTLPYKSCHVECLQILTFLHKQQTRLTGKCGLTSHHLKFILLHLLMDNPTEWNYEQLTDRLNDMLKYLAQRLQAKELHHALVGNSLVPKYIGLPKEFKMAKPTNIFLPMTLDEECYLKTVQHFQELVRNAPVLIQEYGSIKDRGLQMK